MQKTLVAKHASTHSGTAHRQWVAKLKALHLFTVQPIHLQKFMMTGKKIVFCKVGAILGALGQLSKQGR